VSEKPSGQAPAPKPTAPKATGRAIVNAPLDFTLKGLDPDHAYLRQGGFTRETIDHFELGYASRGMMQGRIAIPLLNPDGKLIGYAGRIVDDSVINEETPKYLLPSSRVHDGKQYEFNKSLFLYHGHAVEAPADDLVIVTSFRSTWWTWQNGFRHVVALMGSSCSPQQSQLIIGMVPRKGRVRVFTDGTKVGRYCAEEVLRLVTPYRFCRWIELRDNRKPTDCKPDELRELLA
jgi:DNA primase